MQKENVWYHKQSINLEREVIKYFRENGYWDKVLWSDNEYLDPRKPNEDRDQYLNHTYFEVPEPIYNALYKHLYVFIDMQSRRSPWSSFVYDQKNIHDYVNIFNKMLSLTYKILLQNKISLVIMNRAFHFGGDLLLYFLAKELGIKTLLLEQSLFPNKYFHYFDHYDYGSFKTSIILHPENIESIPRQYEKKLFYMESLGRRPTIKGRIRKSLYKEIRFVKECLNYSGWEQAIQRYALRSRFNRNKKRLTTEKIDFEIPYVYFPLHLQPEKTTASWGGLYGDQLLALERLSLKLPKDWWIYVKENPKQPYIMRGDWFYNRLRSIPKVKLVEANTHRLLHHSKFAATITGTIGWEAITGGKNVLVFGWGVWYKSLPGVFCYGEDLNIKDILDYKIDHSELEEEVAKLKSKMCNGIIYTQYKASFPEYDEAQNTKIVIENFKRILYNAS